jgi:hypothetical protein
MKTVLVLSVIYSLVIFFSSGVVSAQPVILESKKIEYDLPYTGVLPDSPLYVIKKVRDKIWKFFTRDNNDKVRLLLLFADKKANMALSLSQKSKWEAAVNILIEGEQDFVEMIVTMKTAKKQGVSPEGDLLLKTKLSSEKHRQVIEELLKQSPQGQIPKLEKALSISKQSKKDLNSF